MTEPSSPKYDHFKGSNAFQHLKDARLKGSKATAEIHGTEASGSLSAGADSAKETALILTALWILLSPFLKIEDISLISAFFAVGFFIWKMGRSALLGWSRLERLHRLIEEERWEIQHHREQEKEELRAMYSQKGITGKLLDDVVEILMADDNRLLQVMLEEELGLSLESYEHPLKQACGAGIGVLITVLIGAIGVFLGSFMGLIIAMGLSFALATIIISKKEGNETAKALIWSLATATLSLGIVYFLAKLLRHLPGSY